MTTARGRLLATLLLCVGAGTAAKPAPAPECVTAQRWVDAHVHSLPTTIIKFSSYRQSYRRAIYNALPESVRVELWHQQLAYYQNRTELTGAQRTFLYNTDSNLTAFVAGKMDGTDAAFREHARAILGDSLAQAVLANLGVNTPEDGAATSSDAASLFGSCGCSGESDWCATTGPGCNTNVGCTGSSSGCGTFWGYSCNGQCP